jgi:hypothetical protein
MRLAMNLRIDEENARVLFAAIVAWATAVAAASVEDVFGKFDAKSVAIFAVGVALYAFATYRMDRELHAFIQGFPRGAIVAAALVSLGTLAVASLEHLPAIAVFAAPLAAVAAAAAVEKLTARPTKARVKSPAATPAAT